MIKNIIKTVFAFALGMVLQAGAMSQENLNEYLISSINRNNIEDIKDALMKGADKKILISGDSMVSATTRSLELLKFIVDSGGDVNSKGVMALPILFGAVTYGTLDMVQYLIENGAKMNITAGAETVLDRIGGNDGLRKLKFLVQSGIDLNMKGRDGVIFDCDWPQSVYNYCKSIESLIETPKNFISRAYNDGEKANSLKRAYVKANFIDVFGLYKYFQETGNNDQLRKVIKSLYALCSKEDFKQLSKLGLPLTKNEFDMNISLFERTQDSQLNDIDILFKK